MNRPALRLAILAQLIDALDSMYFELDMLRLEGNPCDEMESLAEDLRELIETMK